MSQLTPPVEALGNAPQRTRGIGHPDPFDNGAYHTPHNRQRLSSRGALYRRIWDPSVRTPMHIPRRRRVKDLVTPDRAGSRGPRTASVSR
jgi:hypothetical protein